MKLSYNWLKDYLQTSLSPKEIADAMTSIGIEVDSVSEQEEIPGGLAGVVVAEVLECVAHPDSDHLHITKVNDGSGEPLQVVCGAPNVAKGQKVPEMSDAYVQSVSDRYIELYENIMGEKFIPGDTSDIEGRIYENVEKYLKS